MRDEARRIAAGNALALLLGGIAGAVWMLLFVGDVAVADDCLQYVKNVKNFVAIPKGLLEDCMRTGSVQAIITAAIGGVGGGVIATAVNKGLKDAAKNAPSGPLIVEPAVAGTTAGPDSSSEVQNCGWCGAEMAPGASICPKCNKGKEVCRNCGKKIWSAEANPICPSCTRAGAKEERPAEKAAEFCGWCGAEMPPGGSICPSCNKAKEVCRNCGKKIWSGEADPLCPSCRMAATKDDKPAEKAVEHCGWCGAEMPPGGSICPSCSKAKEVCRKCGRKIWSAEADPICVSCKMAETRASAPPAPAEEAASSANGAGGEDGYDAEDEPADEDESEEPAESDDQEGDDPADKTKPAEPSTQFAQKSCVECGRDLGIAAPADGRCPACGARNPIVGAGAGDATSPSEKSTASGDSEAEPATSTGASTAATSPTPPASSSASASPPADPPFTSQGIIKGDKAADLLEEAGLAKVTRDPSGKVIKIEEAFPGAFTDLGGKDVTLKTSESDGKGAGPNWVEEAKGKITGIAFEPAADGGVGKPVVVVNHGDSQWREQPAPGGATATPASGSGAAPASGTTAAPASGTTAPASGTTPTPPAGSDPAVEANLAEIRSRIEQIDSARAAYNIAKAMMPAEHVLRAAENLARDLGMDPGDAEKLLKMDDRAWAAEKFWAINSQNPAL